jgi:hypothetical protein
MKTNPKQLEISDMVTMYNSGLSTRKIAEIVGRNQKTVHTHLVNAGVTMRPKNGIRAATFHGGECGKCGGTERYANKGKNCVACMRARPVIRKSEPVNVSFQSLLARRFV